MLVVLLTALVLPSRYTSHLKLLVKNERESPLLSIGDQTQAPRASSEVSDARISTEMELLTSGELLRRVVTQTRLDTLSKYSHYPPDERQEAATRDLRKALTVAPAHRSNVIEVTYVAPDPNRAAQVLSTLNQLYQQSQQTLHGTPGSYDFFKALQRSTESALNTAESQMAEFRSTHHLVALPEQKKSLLEHIALLQQSVAISQAEADKENHETQSYSQDASSLPPTVETARRSIPNQSSTQALASTLVGLQNRREEAATRYQPGDRILTDLDAQIRVTQAAIAKAESTPALEVSNGQNPALIASQTELVRSRAGFAGVTAQTARLTAELKGSQQALTALDASSSGYDELNRRVESLSSLLVLYQHKTDEAYVGQMLDQGHFSDIAVVEAPVVEHLATFPKRGLILLLGLVWSLALSLSIVAMLEHSEPRILTQLDLELALGIPILLALPRTLQASAMNDESRGLYLAMQRNAPLADLELL
ncbi:hypothetical protein [Acidipila sp. EB88]|uniref:GumC family protein n=1 Tax=Acidipila sp. EB88 TaxID=2305226 RepID=UPI0013157CE3|nr:hypothetical protein [Acidipila sp. EB88]